MSVASVVADIRAANSTLRGPSGEPDEIWIQVPRACGDADANQVVAFLKPEIMAISNPVAHTAVLTEFLHGLERFDVSIGAIRVVSGRFLSRTGIMARHYGVINSISRLGADALTPTTKEALIEAYPAELLQRSVVSGGHQFLEEHRSFGAAALSDLFSKIGSTRLGPGAYSCAATIEGQSYIILNGFHPAQLDNYTKQDTTCVIFEGTTDSPWVRLRQDLIGATNPANAKPGSFRRLLYDQAAEFDLVDVSSNSNGVHLSAGPLEGMVEYTRFFEGALDRPLIEVACFARLLLNTGLSADQVAMLVENPYLSAEGVIRSAFDLTEEADARAAAKVLAKALGVERIS